MLPGLVTKIFRVVSEAVFPSKCLVCDDFFQPPERACGSISEESGPNVCTSQVFAHTRTAGLLSTWLCPRCIQGLVAVESPHCTCCGLPFRSRQGDDHRCGDCITSPKKFRIARASMVYEKVFNIIFLFARCKTYENNHFQINKNSIVIHSISKKEKKNLNVQLS